MCSIMRIVHFFSSQKLNKSRIKRMKFMVRMIERLWQNKIQVLICRFWESRLNQRRLRFHKTWILKFQRLMAQTHPAFRIIYSQIKIRRIIWMKSLLMESRLIRKIFIKQNWLWSNNYQRARKRIQILDMEAERIQKIINHRVQNSA